MTHVSKIALERFIEKVENLVDVINREVQGNVITTADGKLGHELVEGILIASNMVEVALQDHDLIHEVDSVKLLVEGVSISASAANPDEKMKEVIHSIMEHTKELDELNQTPEMDEYKLSFG